MSRLLYSLFGVAIGSGITYALSRQPKNTNKDNLSEIVTSELAESMETKEDTNVSDSDNSGFSEEEYDQFIVVANKLHESVQKCNDTVAELASHFMNSEPTPDRADANPTSAS